jgi:hypothetical protein
MVMALIYIASIKRRGRRRMRGTRWRRKIGLRPRMRRVWKESGND